jgi:hypothetical protein
MKMFLTILLAVSLHEAPLQVTEITGTRNEDPIHSPDTELPALALSSFPSELTVE